MQPWHLRRLGLTFIVPETTTKPASNQSKTTGTEEEPKGKKEEELSAQEGEENPIGRKRIFKSANKIQFHSAADMKWRVIILMRLSGDKNGSLRNTLGPFFKECGLENAAEGKWQSAGADPDSVARTLSQVLKKLAEHAPHHHRKMEYFCVFLDKA